MVAITTSLFGAVKDGRMTRLPFVIYMSCIQLALLLYVIGVGFAAGLGEVALSGDLDQAQQRLSDFISMPFILFTAVFVLILVFAHLNVLAKRMRDIGLPGWWVLLGYAVFRVVMSLLGYDWLALLLESVAVLTLCFIASKADDTDPVA
jgi:uncharacterized membrane protein YhaH (DUF805 family)